MSSATLESTQATIADLQRRVAALELALAAKDVGPAPAAPPDWRRSLGMFAGDGDMKEINRLGAEIRRSS